MIKRTGALLALCILACSAQRNRHIEDWSGWTFTANESMQKSYDLSRSAEVKKLLVDTMSGYIHVSGYSGSEIKVSVHKQIHARTASALDEAKRDVKLDMSQQGNYVRLYEDGPWRVSNNNTNYRGQDYYGYVVVFDIDVEAPAGVELDLHGFNHGTIDVKHTTGDFKVKGFNGDIDMSDISGSGSVETFNGGMKVAFRKNPERDTRFKTFNGSIDVQFQRDFNADLHFKTFHGDVFSDFEVGPMPSKVAAGGPVGGRYLYRTGGGSGRVGKGGPELWFEGFNGSISLHSKAI